MRFANFTTVSGNPKGLVELDNRNTIAEAKLCLFLFFIPAQEIACRETEVLNTVSSG